MVPSAVEVCICLIPLGGPQILSVSVTEVQLRHDHHPFASPKVIITMSEKETPPDVTPPGVAPF